MSEYVVIGDGAAGTTAAQYIRRRDPDGRITIYSDDPNAAYYRAALTNYLIGELREDQLFAVPPDFYERNRIERVLARVAAVDTANHRIALASGGAPVAYDRLLVAAGSSPNPPPFAGAELTGVMTMRTMQDARAFMEDLRSGRVKRAVVIGGGPLALEWAQALRARGSEVTFVLRGREFMGGVLDPTGSDLVASRLRAFGCDLRMDEEVDEVIGDKRGHVRAVHLKNAGTRVEAQLVCAAIGIRMNTAFLRDSGIRIERGIPVDEHLRTNVPGVYAAGDIAEVYDPLVGAPRGLGLWEPARLQGRVAGSNMGGGDAAYRVGVMYNATRLYDLDFAGIGRTIERDGDRVVADLPKGKGTIAYRKLVVEDGRLVGALLLGHRSEQVRRHGLRLRRLVEEGTPVGEVADQLLDPTFDLPAWMAAQRGEDLKATRQIELGGAVPTYSRLFRMPDLASPLSRAIARPVAGAAVAAPSLIPAAPGPPGAAVGVLEPPRPGAGAPASLAVVGGESIELEGAIRLGRAPDNDLVLGDALVSGHHAEVRQIDGAWVIADAGSRNGTFVNDRQVMAPTPLADGDEIRVGEVRVRFSMPEIAAAEPPVAPEGGAVGAAVSGLFLRPDALEIPPPPAPRVLGVLEGAGRRFELLGSVVSIGRDPRSDVPLDDPAVSGTHAQIAEHEGGLYVRDLGSRNGTYVNRALTSVPHLLRDGDLIHVGDTDLTFRASGPQVVPEPAATAAPVAPEPPAATAPEPAAPAPEPPPAPAPPSPPAQPAPLPPTPPAAPRQARLVVQEGPFVGLAFELVPPAMSVGRDPASDIALSEPTVSWAHARLTSHGAAWTLMDLGSTNGTRVNAAPVEPNREVPVDPGDQIRFGEIVLRLEAGG
ncbi:MAG TPA: FHA domain-containing protein [Actinomycetota bacterium]